MLEQIDMTRKMSKEEFKKRMSSLEPDLARLQRECKAQKLPVMIVFEGFGAAGKGYQIGKLIHSMDPRGFYVRSVGRESEEQRRHPFLWRYWINTPAKGEIAIFDRSWYRKVLLDRFDELLPRRSLSSSFDQINSFERQLTADGTVIIKLFLCIDKKEQKKRFKKLQESSATAWRVSTGDLKRNKEFDRYKEMCDEMLEHTDTSYAPWTLIESMDREFATVKIYTVVIQALQDALAKTTNPKPLPISLEDAGITACDHSKSVGTFTDTSTTDTMILHGINDISTNITTTSDTNKHAEDDSNPETESDTEKSPNNSKYASVDDILRTSSLGTADLSLSLTKEEYKSRLKDLQSHIRQLHGEFYLRQIPVVIGFEGWDAGGKGGAIKRLTEEMDPRGYQVHPTASPNDLEKSHHYLWRFWQNMPKDGHIAIFDRTWYGRVMVERIEGFCSTEEWQRAYQEINDMELQLAQHGTLVLKFWMQIDKDEQERRFKVRLETPEKQWKITDEDWRNREKWDQYEKVVDEMLIRTSTTYAPWTIVEGNDKYYARVKVLETVVHAMEKRLEQK